MKKRFVMLMVILISVFSFNSFVFASCTVEEAKVIQDKLDKIKITYEHITGLVNPNNEVLNGVFKLKINGLTDGLVFYNPERDILFVGEGEGNYALSGFVNGNYEFRLYPYDVECTKPYRVVKLYFPKYNNYSDSYLCNDIDSTKFLPCNKWYEYDLDDETFMARLKEYKEKENKGNQNIINLASKNVSSIFAGINKFWYLYVLCFIFIVISIIVIVKCLKNKEKKKKKNNLKDKINLDQK